MKIQHGFTLIELMVPLAVGAIVLTIGVPSFGDMIRNNRMTTQVNQVVSAMALARSEAVKRGQSVEVTTASGDSDWKDGWTVKVSGGETIRLFEAQKGNHTLVADGGQSTFTYDSQGFLTTACGATCTVSLCLGSGETGRRLRIAPSGHVSVNGSYTCP